MEESRSQGAGSRQREELPAAQPSPWVLCVDPDGRIADLSPALVQLLGFPSAEAARATNALEFGPLVESGLAQDLKRSLETGQPGVFQRQCVGEGGKRLWLKYQLRPIKGSDGRVRHLVAIIEDVSSLYRVEEEARQAQRMEAIGRLSAGLAHDFNNFLTAIFGYTDLLLESVPSDHPWRDSVVEIRQTAERAASLTRKLLAFGRKQALQPRMVDLNELIADMRGTLLPLIGEDVELVTSLDPKLDLVKVDHGQMEQVLLNLVVNAREAMPRGGKLLIETRNASLDEVHGRIHGVRLAPGPYVMMAVTDTGVGMDEETQARVFEPFFTTKEKGTGLGLSVVYGIVKQSGGYIWVYSEPGMGSTFKVYLPACKEPAEARPLEARPQPRRGQGTVLLVEDDQRVRELTMAMLAPCGYRVLAAKEGSQAMELARSNPEVDLLLTDVVMPSMSGVELWEKLGALYPHMRVLFMSGYPEQVLNRYGTCLRDLPFLSKPFSSEELRLKVEEVLAMPPPVPLWQKPQRPPTSLPGPKTPTAQIEGGKDPERPRILIVDDEAAVRRLLARLLEGQGYKCVLAAGAEEARAKLSRESFHLLLCDMRMPGESGLELVREVTPRYPEMAVVFVSGLDDPEVAQMALKQGAYGYILKPFRTNELLIQVANALRRRELEIARRSHVRELERKVDERTQELQRTLSDLRQSMEGIVRAISLTVESRDPYTAGHQRRVAELSRAIARELAMVPARIEGLYMAGLIHDLGKIAVPAEILSKPAKLSSVEFDLIKCHPQVGYEILRPIQFPWPVADMVRQHHEKMDGSGYPLGLKGEEILLEARILVVADVVEAIASHRPYRPALGTERALEEIEQNRGILYDAQVVDACLRLFREKGLDMATLGQKS